MGEIILAVLGIYLLLQIILGYRRGFLKVLMRFAAWILTFAISYYIADYIRQPIAKIIEAQYGSILVKEISYVIAFIAASIVIRICFGFVIHFINKISSIPGVGFVNKLAGAILGFAKGSLVIMFLLFLVAMMPKIGLNTQYEQITEGNEKIEKFLQSNPFLQMFDQKISEEKEHLLEGTQGVFR